MLPMISWPNWVGFSCGLNVNLGQEQAYYTYGRFWECWWVWQRSLLASLEHFHGRKLILVRSMLSSIPIYFISLFHIPRAVRLRLEQNQRFFLWEAGLWIRNPTWFSCNIIRINKDKGYLGVRDLKTLIEHCYVSWFGAMRFLQWREGSSKKRYREENGGWHSNYGMSLWKVIKEERTLLSSGSGILCG